MVRVHMNKIFFFKGFLPRSSPAKYLHIENYSSQPKLACMIHSTFSPLPFSSAVPATLPMQKTCPVCGQENQCAAAHKLVIANCWCMNTVVACTTLAALPATERNRRCICPACARVPKHLHEDSHASIDCSDGAF